MLSLDHPLHETSRAQLCELCVLAASCRAHRASKHLLHRHVYPHPVGRHESRCCLPQFSERTVAVGLRTLTAVGQLTQLEVTCFNPTSAGVFSVPKP